MRFSCLVRWAVVLMIGMSVSTGTLCADPTIESAEAKVDIDAIPILRMGETFAGEVTVSDPVIATEALAEWDYAGSLVHGKRFRLEVAETGRYTIGLEQIPSAVAVIGGSVMGAMFLVLDGHRTWRDAGTDVAELVLAGLGVARAEARRLARSELPPLPRTAT